MYQHYIERNWLGREGSNLRIAKSKFAALPLGYAPSGQEDLNLRYARSQSGCHTRLGDALMIVGCRGRNCTYVLTGMNRASCYCSTLR